MRKFYTLSTPTRGSSTALGAPALYREDIFTWGIARNFTHTPDCRRPISGTFAKRYANGCRSVIAGQDDRGIGTAVAKPLAFAASARSASPVTNTTSGSAIAAPAARCTAS